MSRFAPQARNDVYCSSEPQTSPKRKKKKPIFAVIIVVVIIAAAVFGTYAYSQIKNDINGTEKGAATKYTLVISKEDYEYEVGQKLYNNGESGFSPRVRLYPDESRYFSQIGQGLHSRGQKLHGNCKNP